MSERDEARTPVRGQAVELSAIIECLREARVGRGSVTLLEGRRGLGKTRVLHEATVVATTSGFRIGSGAAFIGDGTPMAPLIAALFGGPAPLLDRERVDVDTRVPVDPGRAVDQLEAAIAEVAPEAPVLICIDDLQWADAATVTVLRSLPHRLRHLPVAWVMTLRSRGGSPAVLDLVAHLSAQGAHPLSLRPLDASTITEVVADIVRAEPTADLLELTARAGGNPALVVDVVRGLVDEGAVRVDDGRAELSEATRVPRRVSDAVGEDLARMSGPARRAATVTSVLGSGASCDRVAAMLEVSPASLLGPLEELVRAELVVDTGSGLGFQSPLIREAVADTIPPSVRLALQRQAIEMLLDAGESPVGPATDLAASAEPGDRVGISTLAAAARAIAPWDAEAAANLSRRTLELTAGAEDLRAALIAEMALQLHIVGRAEEGKRHADEALRDCLPVEAEGEIRLSIARMSDLAPDARAKAGRDALALPDLPLLLRARHTAEHVGNLASAGRRDPAWALLAQAEETVVAAGDREAELALAAAKAELAYADGTFRDALRHLDPSLGSPDDSSQIMSRVDLLRAELFVALDKFNAVHSVASRHLAAAERTGRATAVRAWRRVQGRCMFQEGKLLDAAVTLDRSFDAEAPSAVRTVSDAATMVALGRLAVHVGDARRARQITKLAQGVLATGAPELRRQAAWLLALDAMAGGDAVVARSRLAELGDDAEATLLPRLMVDTTDWAQLARIARSAGDAELGSSTVAAVQSLCRRNPGVKTIAAVATHARGIVECDSSILSEAVGLLAGGPRPMAEASALEDWGVALVREGNKEDGAEVLGRALRTYADHGAVWDASRVRRRLRDLGVRRRLVKAVRPASGWDGLTDAEVAVVNLVADGLTNRQVAERLYVSPHTVSMHLRHVFTKLGITSRVELTRLTIQQENAA
jgi:DNA-binding CsgD family transcriptional regulator